MTRFVVGGVYVRQIGTASTSTGVLIGATQHGSGRRAGVMYTEGFSPLGVVEGSPSMEEWTLIQEPVSSEMLRALEESWFHKVEAMEARIQALEAAAATEDEPSQNVAGSDDPLNNLLQVNARTKPQKSARP